MVQQWKTKATWELSKILTSRILPELLLWQTLGAVAPASCLQAPRALSEAFLQHTPPPTGPRSGPQAPGESGPMADDRKKVPAKLAAHLQVSGAAGAE